MYDGYDPITICVGCGMADPDMVTVDFGIGHYEYWGATGYHTDEHVVTRCCECETAEFWPEPNPNLIPEDLVAEELVDA